MTVQTGASRSAHLREELTYDMGLRRHMLSVYNYMSLGILVTAIVAIGFTVSGMADSVFSGKHLTLLGLVIIFAPLAYSFFLAKNIREKSLGYAQFTFWSFCAVMGLSMSTVFLAYTATSIATTFLATSAAFAGLSLYGYTTKRDLGPIGSFLIMSLWGLIAGLVLNLIVGSEPMAYLLSAAGIVIFAGLTAYDTQKARADYRENASLDTNERVAIYSAIMLYLDFINLMLHLLRFMGVRRN